MHLLLKNEGNKIHVGLMSPFWTWVEQHFLSIAQQDWRQRKENSCTLKRTKYIRSKIQVIATHPHTRVCCTWFINQHDTSMGRYGNLLWFVFCCSCQFTRILHVILRGYCVHFIMVIGRGMSIAVADTIDHTALIVSIHDNNKTY